MLKSYPKIFIELVIVIEVCSVYHKDTLKSDYPERLLQWLIKVYGVDALKRFEAEIRKIHCIFGINWKLEVVGLELQNFMDCIYDLGPFIRSEVIPSKPIRGMPGFDDYDFIIHQTLDSYF